MNLKAGLSLCARVFAKWAVGAIAVMVVRLSSPDRVHDRFWQVSRLIFLGASAFYRIFKAKPRGECWQIIMLRRALTAMTRERPGFDLKVKVLGQEELKGALDGREPVFIFTAHFGLTLAAPQVLVKMGHRPALIAQRANSSDGWHWGLSEALWVLGDDPQTFLRARRAAKNGAPIICYVDYSLPEYDLHHQRVVFISPNAFQLAHRLSARVLFLTSRLEVDGTIIIEFSRASRDRLQLPEEADLCAAEFAAFATERTGWCCFVRALKPYRLERNS